MKVKERLKERLAEKIIFRLNEEQKKHIIDKLVTSSEVSDYLSEEKKRAIYNMMHERFVYEDTLYELDNSFESLTDDEKESVASTVAKLYVYDGDSDSNLTYWNDIDRLIYKVIIR